MHIENPSFNSPGQLDIDSLLPTTTICCDISTAVRSDVRSSRVTVLAKIVGDTRSAYLAPGELRNFVVLFADGKCLEYVQTDTPPPRKDFEFIFEFPASIFEEVAAGQIDLIDAGLKGKIKITGDMRILIRHAELVNVIYGVYSQEIETTWPKGKPGTVPDVNAAAAS